MFRTTKQLIGGILFLILSILYGIGATSIELFVVGTEQAFTARTLPFTLSIIGGGCSLLLILIACIGILKKKQDAKNSTAITEEPTSEHTIPEPNTTDPTEQKPTMHWKTLGLFLVLMTLYAFFFPLIGFILATTGFIFGGAFILGERRVLRTLGISLAIVMGFWLIISQLLDIYLAPGSVWGFIIGRIFS